MIFNIISINYQKGKKKEKDLTAGRTIESLYEELVQAGIIQSVDIKSINHNFIEHIIKYININYINNIYVLT